MKEKNKKTITLIIVVSLIIAIAGVTFAYFRWQTSREQETSVTFTVTSDFSCSADGGDELNSNSIILAPTDCTNSDYAIKRKVTTNSVINSQDQTVYMDLWLDIVLLDSELANTENFKWVFTKEENNCSENNAVSYGTFEELTTEDKVMLLDSKKYISTTQDDTYYLYIWLDKAETSTSTMDKNFEFKLNGECLEIPSEYGFDVINVSNNYQLINATVNNEVTNIESYAVTQDSAEPLFNNFNDIIVKPLINNSNSKLSEINEDIEWIDIQEEEQNTKYNFVYSVDKVGTYTIWFKDELGRIVSNQIEIDEIYEAGPICGFSSFSDELINTGEESEIYLTCIDNVANISNKDITKEDITLSNNYVNISDEITKKNINNGYQYKFTLTALDNIGKVSLTLKENTITNIHGNGNLEHTSTSVIVNGVFSVTYKDIGNEKFSGIHDSEYITQYTYGNSLTLDTPTKVGYTFAGYYLSSNGSEEPITTISDTQKGNLTLYAKWIDDIAPTGTANASLIDDVVNVTVAANDDGTGLSGNYSWLISTNSTCDATTTGNFVINTNTSHSFTLSTSGTYYVCVKVEDNSGNIGYMKSSGLKYSTEYILFDNGKTVDYTGGWSSVSGTVVRAAFQLYYNQNTDSSQTKHAYSNTKTTVNVTKYKKLYATITGYNTSYAFGAGAQLYIGSKTVGVNTGTISIDVSGLTGSYTIGFHVWGYSNAYNDTTIYVNASKVWLE